MVCHIKNKKGRDNMMTYQSVGEFHPFENISLVRMDEKAGHKIACHSHPSELVIFTCTKGKVEMTIGEEIKLVQAGDNLAFDGDVTIEGIFLEDSQVSVVLIKK